MRFHSIFIPRIKKVQHNCFNNTTSVRIHKKIRKPEMCANKYSQSVNILMSLYV